MAIGCPQDAVPLLHFGNPLSRWSLLWSVGVTAVKVFWLLFSLGTLHKAFPQEERVQVRPSSNPPGSVSKVCGIFNNKVLPSNSWKKPRAVAITTLFEESLDSPGFSCLVLGFLLNSLW